jgi:hypothetical protein
VIVGNGLADHPQGRGFHLAVMLGCVPNPVNPRAGVVIGPISI